MGLFGFGKKKNVEPPIPEMSSQVASGVRDAPLAPEPLSYQRREDPFPGGMPSSMGLPPLPEGPSLGYPNQGRQPAMAASASSPGQIPSQPRNTDPRFSQNQYDMYGGAYSPIPPSVPGARSAYEIPPAPSDVEDMSQPDPLPPLPGSRPSSLLDIPDVPSFAQKYGTHPDEELQGRIEKEHARIEEEHAKILKASPSEELGGSQDIDSDSEEIDDIDASPKKEGGPRDIDNFLSSALRGGKGKNETKTSYLKSSTNSSSSNSSLSKISKDASGDSYVPDDFSAYDQKTDRGDDGFRSSIFGGKGAAKLDQDAPSEYSSLPETLDFESDVDEIPVTAYSNPVASQSKAQLQEERVMQPLPIPIVKANDKSFVGKDLRDPATARPQKGVIPSPGVSAKTGLAQQDRTVGQVKSTSFSQNAIKQSKDFSDLNEKVDNFVGRISVKRDLSQPLFVSMDTCSVVNGHIEDVKMKIKGIDVSGLISLEKESDQSYKDLKTTIISIQSSLMDIDKKLFKQVV